MTTAEPISLLVRVSPFAARRFDARPALREACAQSLDQPWHAEEMHAWLAARPTDSEAQLNQSLRQLREAVWARTAARDVAGLASLQEVTTAFSLLADISVRQALDWHAAALTARHGQPRFADGRAMDLVVVAMGKLGGGELNVSSDIDLIALYPEEGETGGERPISHHEFFTRLTRKLNGALSEMTEDGYVFRVDLRLRPWGDSGPLAMSYAMLEDYLAAHGRPWERYAWIKARPISGQCHDALAAIITPFVYRKYFDYGAYQSLRDLHAQIRREVIRHDRQNNIKLGPGGIREVEFIAQVFQLIRGGQDPELRILPTRQVLAQLARRGLLDTATVAALDAAYVYLRRLEHALQYREDAQTQTLPDSPDALAQLALALREPDTPTLLATLDRHRRIVAQHFELVFSAPQHDEGKHPLRELWLGLRDLPTELARLGYAQPGDSATELQRLRERFHRILPEASRLRIDTLMPAFIELAAQSPTPDTTLTRLTGLLEAIAGRQTYLALLIEHPAVLAQLTRLLAASPWAALLMTRQPALLDELIDPQLLFAPVDWAHETGELSAALARCANDTEAQMDGLRRYRQRHTLHLLAQDVAGALSVEKLSDELAALADSVLGVALERVWLDMKDRHLDTPRFAIIAYGKLGGKEAGYASDLDLVFLYDDADPDASTRYARLAQRLNTWLSTPTACGVLYETDLRLRPDGGAGLLVSSVAAFSDYQLKSAWTWEHQALTRARFVCGDATIGAAFERIRRDILALPRERATLLADVQAMRQKMLDGHPNRSGLFDLKHDPGGLIDVEFCVQTLILLHAHEHPALLDNVGNIALLHRAAETALLATDLADAAADAYRALRLAQHRAKLAGSDYARVPADGWQPTRLQVTRLWRTLFPASAYGLAAPETS